MIYILSIYFLGEYVPDEEIDEENLPSDETYELKNLEDMDELLPLTDESKI